MKRDKRTSAQAESLQRQTQKQQEMYLATFASTLQNIYFKFNSEESGKSSDSEAEKFKPVREPSTTFWKPLDMPWN